VTEAFVGKANRQCFSAEDGEKQVALGAFETELDLS
jgi:hypothetical protein